MASEPPRASGQVVDVAPSKDSTPPRSSRFLSEHDSTVEKETVSRFAGTKHFENTLPAPSDGAKKRPQADAGEGGVAKESKEGKQEPEAKGTGAEQLGVPRQPAQDRLAMVERPGGTRPGDVKVAPKEERERVSGQGETLQVPGTPGASVPGQRKAGDPRLLPSMDSLARIAGGPSNDFLRDVEEGETTALNTRAFKYATFWNRFKGAISEQWRPAIVYNSRDPDGRLFGSQDRETRLEVVLDGESGALKSIRVVGQSGLDFLDREAVRAVQTAAPFPNPPRALADERGEIRFPFGMVVVLNHLSGLHPIYSPGPSQRPFPE